VTVDQCDSVRNGTLVFLAVWVMASYGYPGGVAGFYLVVFVQLAVLVGWPAAVVPFIAIADTQGAWIYPVSLMADVYCLSAVVAAYRVWPMGRQLALLSGWLAALLPSVGIQLVQWSLSEYTQKYDPGWLAAVLPIAAGVLVYTGRRLQCHFGWCHGECYLC